MRILTTILMMSLNTLCFASDQWITSGRDIEYPNDFYFVGVGLSERGSDFAKQNAMVEVKKQLSVNVNASTLDEQSSLIAGGKEVAVNKVESRARLITSGDVQGIEVVKTAQQGKIFYALAVLDKKKFSSNTKTKIAELKGQLATLVDGAKADIAAAKISQALVKMASAKQIIMQILSERTLLSASAELTDAEKLNYTMTDIALLYEKCVGSLRMAKTAGDNQVFAVGMVPSEPFVVSVSAENAPVPQVPVNLLDDNNKVVLQKYTDDAGKADFYIGEKADMSTGRHSYTAAVGLTVSYDMKKVLAGQNQTFSYTVTSNPCFAKKITVNVDPALAAGLADITKKVVARLAKYDIKEDGAAPTELVVTLLAKETGTVQGLSENNTFVKTDVTMTLSLRDDEDKELANVSGTAKGTGGSLIKSALQGSENVKIEKDLKPLLDKMCSSKSATKLKIAVFEFKTRSYYASWYDLSINLEDMLITKLINTGRFDVVERSQLNRIMEEKSLAQSGVVEDKEALQIAQLAGADVILVGAATIAGGKIEADARIVDMKSGVAKCAMSSSAYSLSDLRDVADDLIGQIKGKCYK